MFYAFCETMSVIESLMSWRLMVVLCCLYILMLKELLKTELFVTQLNSSCQRFQVLEMVFRSRLYIKRILKIK